MLWRPSRTLKKRQLILQTVQPRWRPFISNPDNESYFCLTRSLNDNTIGYFVLLFCIIIICFSFINIVEFESVDVKTRVYISFLSERARLETTEAAVASGKNSSGDDGVYNQQTGLTTSTLSKVSIKHVSAGRLPLFFVNKVKLDRLTS